MTNKLQVAKSFLAGVTRKSECHWALSHQCRIKTLLAQNYISLAFTQPILLGLKRLP